MIKGKTITGFEFSVDERALNDWNFTRLLGKISKYEENEKKYAEVEDKDSIALEMLENTEGYKDSVEKLLKLVLGGEKGMNAAFDFVAEKNDGFIMTNDVVILLKEVLAEISRINSSLKKSMPSPTS